MIRKACLLVAAGILWARDYIERSNVARTSDYFRTPNMLVMKRLGAFPIH